MLFVGDIHINSKISNQLLSKLKESILWSGEENIIFLGDYVYHFVYDRAALMELFNFFLDLVNQNKKLYILAGNHDWIQNHFVFAEWYTIFSKLINFKKLNFIIQPLVEEIEWQKILFLPHNPLLDWKDTFEKYGLNINKSTIYDSLINFKNIKESYSGYLNKFLFQFVEKNKIDLIVHHFYTVDTAVPDRKTKFTFKDISLDKIFLTNKDFKIISWHLHQPFVFQNYLCCGSVWATNSLESNQFKYLFSYDWKNFEAKHFFVNWYIEIDLQKENIEFLDLEKLENYIKNLYYKSGLQQEGNFDIKIGKIDNIDWSNISLIVVDEDLSYDNLFDKVDKKLTDLLKEVKIKKKIAPTMQMINLLDQSAENLKHSISNRFDLLQKYIISKYPSEKDKYLEVLKEVME